MLIFHALSKIEAFQTRGRMDPAEEREQLRRSCITWAHLARFRHGRGAAPGFVSACGTNPHLAKLRFSSEGLPLPSCLVSGSLGALWVHGGESIKKNI